jgi:hypothetical protein
MLILPWSSITLLATPHHIGLLVRNWIVRLKLRYSKFGVLVILSLRRIKKGALSFTNFGVDEELYDLTDESKAFERGFCIGGEKHLQT